MHEGSPVSSGGHQDAERAGKKEGGRGGGGGKAKIYPSASTPEPTPTQPRPAQEADAMDSRSAETTPSQDSGLSCCPRDLSSHASGTTTTTRRRRIRSHTNSPTGSRVLCEGDGGLSPRQVHRECPLVDPSCYTADVETDPRVHSTAPPGARYVGSTEVTQGHILAETSFSHYQIVDGVTTSHSTTDDALGMSMVSRSGSPGCEVHGAAAKGDLRGSCLSSCEDSAQGGRLPSNEVVTEEAAETVESEGEGEDRVGEVLLRDPRFRTALRSHSPTRRHTWEPGKRVSWEDTVGHQSWCPVILEPQENTHHLHSMSLDQLDAMSQVKEEAGQCVPDGSTPTLLDLRRTLMMGGTRDKRDMQTRQMENFRHSMSCIAEAKESHTHLKNVWMPNASLRHLNQTTPISPLCRSTKPAADRMRISLQPNGVTENSAHATSWLGSKEDGMQAVYGSNISLSEDRDEAETGRKGSKKSEEKGGIGRTFSFLKNRMSSIREKNKGKQKEKDRLKERDKEKGPQMGTGHQFEVVSPPPMSAHCRYCSAILKHKEAMRCQNCSVMAHKACKDKVPPCPMNKLREIPSPMQLPDTGKPTFATISTTPQRRERPRSVVLPNEAADLMFSDRSHTFRTPISSSTLSKSVSTINMAGGYMDMDKGVHTLLGSMSQSIDSLVLAHQNIGVSMESLTDEGDMSLTNLMYDFEMEQKLFEAESWSVAMDEKFVKKQKKDIVRRQEVIYELIQTEMNYVRTLRILSEVYRKGLQNDVQLDQVVVDRIFPRLDELNSFHTQFLDTLLTRQKDSLQPDSQQNFVIHHIGDLLLEQFTGDLGVKMKDLYGAFCSKQSESVSNFKELLTKDKKMQIFVRKQSKNPQVRRKGFLECVLLVTQRITKYPPLLDRILKYTKEGISEHMHLTRAVSSLRAILSNVDEQVSQYRKQQRLEELVGRIEAKAHTTFKSGLPFNRDDMLTNELIHDGPLVGKMAPGRTKDIHAVLLKDCLIFLQEKDQKYVFASLDQMPAAISLQKLLVRPMANQSCGLFLINTTPPEPRMFEVFANKRDVRNKWYTLLRQAVDRCTLKSKDYNAEMPPKDFQESMERLVMQERVPGERPRSWAKVSSPTEVMGDSRVRLSSDNEALRGRNPDPVPTDTNTNLSKAMENLEYEEDVELIDSYVRGPSDGSNDFLVESMEELSNKTKKELLLGASKDATWQQLAQEDQETVAGSAVEAKFREVPSDPVSDYTIPLRPTVDQSSQTTDSEETKQENSFDVSEALLKENWTKLQKEQKILDEEKAKVEEEKVKLANKLERLRLEEAKVDQFAVELQEQRTLLAIERECIRNERTVLEKKIAKLKEDPSCKVIHFLEKKALESDNTGWQQDLMKLIHRQYNLKVVTKDEGTESDMENGKGAEKEDNSSIMIFNVEESEEKREDVDVEENTVETCQNENQTEVSKDPCKVEQVSELKLEVDEDAIDMFEMELAVNEGKSLESTDTHTVEIAILKEDAIENDMKEIILEGERGTESQQLESEVENEIKKNTIADLLILEQETEPVSNLLRHVSEKVAAENGCGDSAGMCAEYAAETECDQMLCAQVTEDTTSEVLSAEVFELEIESSVKKQEVTRSTFRPDGFLKKRNSEIRGKGSQSSDQTCDQLNEEEGQINRDAEELETHTEDHSLFNPEEELLQDFESCQPTMPEAHCQPTIKAELDIFGDSTSDAMHETVTEDISVNTKETKENLSDFDTIETDQDDRNNQSSEASESLVVEEKGSDVDNCTIASKNKDATESAGVRPTDQGDESNISVTLNQSEQTELEPRAADISPVDGDFVKGLVDQDGMYCTDAESPSADSVVAELAQSLDHLSLLDCSQQTYL
uniref:A-kinase anchor protein 13-like isoform X4 n=1 Tax=Petromyzon marinus TaxID=7757 RepID=A0AAJ7TNT6_PETMA|nr:A-kinase anchor protein 13-like isoform X4 [Petromyzon marinus]